MPRTRSVRSDWVQHCFINCHPIVHPPKGPPAPSARPLKLASFVKSNADIVLVPDKLTVPRYSFVLGNFTSHCPLALPTTPCPWRWFSHLLSTRRSLQFVGSSFHCQMYPVYKSFLADIAESFEVDMHMKKLFSYVRVREVWEPLTYASSGSIHSHSRCRLSRRMCRQAIWGQMK